MSLFKKELFVYAVDENGNMQKLTGEAANEANKIANENDRIIRGLLEWNQKMEAEIRSGSKAKTESKPKPQVKSQQRRGIFSFLRLPNYTAAGSDVSHVDPNPKPQNGMVAKGEDTVGKQKLVVKIRDGYQNADAFAKAEASRIASQTHSADYDAIKDYDSKMGIA